MRRVSVDSTAIVSVGYDDWSKNLDVEYEGGCIYRYFRVPQVLYRDLMTAESAGRFVNFYIKPYFQYRQIDQEPSQAKSRNQGRPLRHQRSKVKVVGGRPTGRRRGRRSRA